jgi:glucosamine 6-phosphate synthetase-like amidotransferase/phosphosugar isomerase protein
MCGIFGQISKNKINQENFDKLVKHSEQRGIDSSGLIYYKNDRYEISRADYNIEKLLKKVKPYDYKIVLGHSRLITNGLGDNQPVIRDNICAIHNGIIVNEKDVWNKLTVTKKYQIDPEASPFFK